MEFLIIEKSEYQELKNTMKEIKEKLECLVPQQNIKYLTVKEYAKLHRCSAHKIYTMIEENELPCKRIGKKILIEEGK